MNAAQTATARKALALLIAINLFCYLDRYILASILPELKKAFLEGDPNAYTKEGFLSFAFIVSYMITAPIFGWLADRGNRWVIIGCSVGLWSLASGASGLAATFWAFLATRAFLGLGEAGYGPAAPSLISDFYPVEKRGWVLSWFFMAIPLGSALGYGFGDFMVDHWGWRWAFYLVTPPGLLLAALCFLQPDSRIRSGSAPKPTLAEYRQLLRIPSLVTNILAQAALTFAMGGLSIFAPQYITEERHQEHAGVIFGAILAGTGIVATLLGGWLGDKLRPRFAGAYFLVSGVGMLLAFPCTAAMLYAPFPAAWYCVGAAMFFLFLNTGPSNTALANVTPAALRATAFALNILIIHLFGDASSPTLIGWIKDHGSWNLSFLTVSAVMLVAGIVWLLSMPALARDTALASAREEPLV
jgi:MFS family permease